jgi:hypothetical protein
MKTDGIVNGVTLRGNNFQPRGRGVEKRIRTECSVEIDDVFVVKRLGRSVEGWCAGCVRRATLVTPEDAATLLGTGARFIYRLVESGEIHWAEGPADLLLVCLNSLLEKTGQNFHTE